MRNRPEISVVEVQLTELNFLQIYWSEQTHAHATRKLIYCKRY